MLPLLAILHVISLSDELYNKGIIPEILRVLVFDRMRDLSYQFISRDILLMILLAIYVIHAVEVIVVVVASRKVPIAPLSLVGWSIGTMVFGYTFSKPMLDLVSRLGEIRAASSKNAKGSKKQQ